MKASLYITGVKVHFSFSSFINNYFDIYIDDNERELCLKTANFHPGSEHIVKQANIFENVISMCGIVAEYSLFVEYRDEEAIDLGGVQKDMFLHLGLMSTNISLKGLRP